MNHSSINKKTVFVLLLLLATAFCPGLKAQQADSTAILRTFITVSRSYQMLPFQVNLECRNSTNLVLQEEDTATIQASFHRNRSGGYMRFGDLEQIVSDSMALLVSRELKRIVVYTNAQEIINYMRSALALPIADSSMGRLASKYQVKDKEHNTTIRAIDLFSRSLVPGTHLPKEQVELRYRLSSGEPEAITTTRRSLIAISAADSLQLVQQPRNAGMLITMEGEGSFFVKEQVSIFRFIDISHDNTAAIPVRISDRVIKNEKGAYVPAKGYEAFSVTQNF